MSQSEASEISVTKTFNAPVEKVFAYFTDPALLRRWHTPLPSTPPVILVDLSVGGSYRFEMTDPEGKVHVAVGKYLEIVPEEKLVFSWKWEGAPGPDTTVTVLFHAKGDSTEVSLHHTGFADKETMGHHAQGWEALLGNLANALS